MPFHPSIEAEEKLAEAILNIDRELARLQEDQKDNGDLYCHLKNVSHSAHQFWQFIMKRNRQIMHETEAYQTRMALNIQRVSNALAELTRKGATVTSQWEAIQRVQYESSWGERFLATAKKILMTLCAAALGFIGCTLMGLSVTGGIIGVPAAIYASIKAAAALWGIAGAGAATTVALGPTVWGILMAQGQMTKETGSPDEKEMIKIRNIIGKKSKSDLGRSIRQKMQILSDSPNQQAQGAHHLLKAILAYANALEHSASQWDTLDYVTKREKSQILYQATEQVLEQLTPSGIPDPDKLSKKSIFSLKVTLNGKIQPYESFLKKKRHPHLNSIFGFFGPKATRTEIVAEKACDIDRFPSLG